MKVCAISGDRLYLRLGETFDNSRWYTVTDEVKKVADTINRGDTVEVKAEQKNDGKLYLTEIKKTASAPPSASGSSSSSEKKYWDKSPEVQKSIRRQAIGHMTSRALISLQGIVDINNITSVAETLYKKFRTLVEEN